MANIKVGISISSDKELNEHVIGERISDYISHFTALYKDAILEILKHSRWGLLFTQTSEIIPAFAIDIYVDSFEDYQRIQNFIKSNPPNEIDIHFLDYRWGFNSFNNGI